MMSGLNKATVKKSTAVFVGVCNTCVMYRWCGLQEVALR